MQICLFNYGVEGVVWTTAAELHYCKYYSYSEIVNFTVVSSDNMMFTAKPLNISKMTITIMTVLVAIVCVGVGLLVYFKKRKH